MSKLIYDIIEEPVGKIYRNLIDYSIQYCNSFLLVIQGVEWFNNSAFQFLERSSPYLKEKKSASEWPGTKLGSIEDLVEEKATVYYFNLNSKSSSLLKEVANGLYDWLQPDLPEDLCLLRPDGSPWLVSISHEKDSYLELTREEKILIEKAIPNLLLKKMKSEINGVSPGHGNFN